MSRVIDLQGSQGNAFALMGIADGWLRQMNRRHEFNAMREEMMSGDYNNLLTVFKKKFGDLVEFYNAPEDFDERALEIDAEDHWSLQPAKG